MQIKVPGKLFIMGEYAVMESGYSGVVAAINRFLTVTITDAQVFSVQSSHGTINGYSELDDDGTMTHVKAALRIAFSYLEEQCISCRPFKLEIESELETRSKKYGFGSSGVVIVGVIEAVMKYHDCHVSKEILFKLSVLAQRYAQDLSSGGDLAAAIYHGLIVYTTYDRTWLESQPLDRVNLVNVPWPRLKIEPLKIKYKAFKFGWTKQVNRTGPFVARVQEFSVFNHDAYTDFLNASRNSVTNFVSAWQSEAWSVVSQEIRNYRALMVSLGLFANVEIETERLTQLIETAEQCGYAAKISGSGGGDCGLAFTPLGMDATLEHQWQLLGIEPLDVEVYYGH